MHTQHHGPIARFRQWLAEPYLSQVAWDSYRQGIQDERERHTGEMHPVAVRAASAPLPLSIRQIAAMRRALPTHVQPARVTVTQVPVRAQLAADVAQMADTEPVGDDTPTVETPRAKSERGFRRAITGLLGSEMP